MYLQMGRYKSAAAAAAAAAVHTHEVENKASKDLL